MAQFIKNRFIKVILWVVAGLFLILFSAIIALQIPAVQTRIVTWIGDEIEKKTGFRTDIQRVSIRWFDIAHFQGVEVYDTEGNLMVHALGVTVDFEIRPLLNKTIHQIDEAIIEGADVFLTYVAHSDTSDILNISLLLERLRKPDAGQRPVSLGINRIQVRESTFRFVNPQKDSLGPEVIDYNRFNLQDLTVDAYNFRIYSDTLEMRINRMSMMEESKKFPIHHLSANFRMSQSALEFYQLDLHAGKSRLGDTLVFTYDAMRDMANFNELVRIKAHFSNSIINTEDLALFAPTLRKYPAAFEISGDFSGRVWNFNVRNLSLKTGASTQLFGSLSMTGLPNFSETFINLRMENSEIEMTDLWPYMSRKVYDRIKKYGLIRANGRFLGFPNDFVASGDFSSQRLGRAITDLNLKINDNDKIEYSGNLNAIEADLGTLFEARELFGRVTLNGNIRGTGTTIEDADVVLKGEVKRIQIQNYTYRNIKSDARFSRGFFSGDMSINDPNLRFTASGSIDIRDKINVFNIKADLDTAILKPLGLSEKHLVLKTSLDINARGLELDSIVGMARFNQNFIAFEDKTLEIDSLFLTSTIEGNHRNLSIESNLFSAKASGEFSYSQFGKDLSTLFHEYQLNLANDQEATKAYYASKVKTTGSNYSLNYSLQLVDINPLFGLISQDLYLSPNTLLSGSFMGGETYIFDVGATIDTIVYEGKLLKTNHLEINLSKLADSTNVLGIGYFTSQQQVVNEKLKTKNLFTEAVWFNSHIDFSFDVSQEEMENYARLKGSIDLLDEYTSLTFDPSEIKLLDTYWGFARSNEITIRNKEVVIENLELSSGFKSVLLEGVLSEDPSQALIIEVNDIDLRILNPLLSKEISGLVNGDMVIKDYYGNMLIENSFLINDFSINSFLVGEILGENIWNNTTRRFDVDLSIDRERKRIIGIKGTYSPYEEDQLDLDAVFNNANINILEPFIESFFSKLAGEATGKFVIDGKLSRPTINGSGVIENGFLHINYLNTGYKVGGNFRFSDYEILLDDMRLTDSDNNLAILSGNVVNEAQGGFRLNLLGNMTRFMVLNTGARDNDLFYGSGYATGQVRIQGLLNNLRISANAKTERGTRIYIPMGDTESIEQEEYIRFVSLTDTLSTLQLTDQIEKLDLRGLTLDFELDITPDAYCEIIFDIKSGDIIRGRGNGNIKLQITTAGEFNMFGDVEFIEGGYNFTLYNIINKDFEVLPKSKITWYGDPYQGIMDVKATYRQLASFSPLLDTALLRIPEIRRKYPTNVVLELKGPLLSPAINFDITTVDLPRSITTPRGNVDLEFEFNSFMNRIDEQELKRQVFSLIVLRRFSPPESFNTGGSVGSSVSELLSNQLSYWLSQVDENLDIDLNVDLGKMNAEDYNTFQLRLSYSFLDGRLRLTRGGGFTDPNNQASLATIAGDWSVEYLLSADGKLRVRMYNRTNFSAMNTNLGIQNPVTTGFSLQHTQSFNEVKDLFKKARKKAEELPQEEEEPQKTPEKPADPPAIDAVPGREEDKGE